MSQSTVSSLHQIDMSILKEEDIQQRTVTSRTRIRAAVEADVEAFLNKGGSVQEIPKGLRADPPKKPNTSYGSRPI